MNPTRGDFLPGRTMTSRIPFACAALLAVTLAACGSSDDSARDDALAALDRATESAGLEAEMAALVGDLQLEPSEKESTTFVDSVEQLDTRAGDLLASADTGEPHDEEITSATEQIQGAGRSLTAAAKKPESLTAARKKAVRDLKGSNQDLRVAAGLIGAELEDDEGELSAEDDDAVNSLRTEIEQSSAAVTDAGKQIATQEAEAEAAEQAAAEEAAAEAAAEEAPAPAPSSGGCPAGTFPVPNADGSVSCSSET